MEYARNQLSAGQYDSSKETYEQLKKEAEKYSTILKELLVLNKFLITDNRFDDCITLFDNMVEEAKKGIITNNRELEYTKIGHNPYTIFSRKKMPIDSETIQKQEYHANQNTHSTQ